MQLVVFWIITLVLIFSIIFTSLELFGNKHYFVPGIVNIGLSIALYIFGHFIKSLNSYNAAVVLIVSVFGISLLGYWAWITYISKFIHKFYF